MYVGYIDSLAYNALTKTFNVSDDFPFILEITGENLTMFNEKGGLQAKFKQEKSGGWAIINVDIVSDTLARASVQTSTLTYILNDGLGSTVATAVMLENNNNNNQIGETIDVKLKHAPAFMLTINNGENGIFKGASGTEFAPDNNITREQIATIMHRYAQYKGIDVSVGESTLGPLDNATRVEVAAILHRFIEANKK